MSVRWLHPGGALAAARGEVVVSVICDGEWPSQLSRLAEVTSEDATILLIGCGTLPGPETLPERDLVALKLGPGQAPTAALTTLAGLLGDGDLVLLDHRVTPPPGWLSRLVAAAGPDVGTVSPLYGSIVGGVGEDPAERDRRLGATASSSGPRVAIGAPHCLYVPRRTMQLIGGIPSAASLAEATAAISERCRRTGLVNVIADDLFVASSGADGQVNPAESGLGERGPLMRALRSAAAAVRGPSVTVDARSLGGSLAGTQRYALELTLALARYTDLEVRAVHGGAVDPVASRLLEHAGVELISYEQATQGVPRTDIVHRPQQVFSLGDLNLLSLLGQRTVITHSDLIAYHNPSYHADADTFAAHRTITREALAVADRVIFLSEHSCRDALSEDLVTPDGCEVIGAAVFAPDPPGDAGEVPDGPYILCLGSDYRHKNRPFAMALTAQLRRRQGWTGRLVLAGGHVEHGSSREQEQRMLGASPELRDAVLDLGPVTEAQRIALLARARAVIVPSVTEGFGLVPLEAAQASVPCLFAPQPPLTEVIDPELATLVAWDPALSAAQVAPLLTGTQARREHLERLTTGAARWSWEALAVSLRDCYARTLQSPYRLATTHTLRLLEREAHFRRIELRLSEVAVELSDLQQANADAATRVQALQVQLAAAVPPSPLRRLIRRMRA